MIQLAVRVKIFGHLVGEVIRKNLCSLCGACIASCPVVALTVKNEVPTITGRCVLCGYCYNQCPKTPFDWKIVEEKLFGGTGYGPLGHVESAYVARATNPRILEVSQDGGAVTALLHYALEAKIIDCAVVSSVSEEKPWLPKPTLAFNLDELLKAAGSKYTSSPNHIALASAVYEYGLERIGFVGVGCQIRALRKMQFSDYGATKLGSKVKFAIGLFCSETFYYKKLVEEFLSSRGVDVSRITRFEIAAGKFTVKSGKEILLSVPVKEVKVYAREACEKCGDFTAELADISVGSVDSPKGWSTVLIRTSSGKKLFTEAVKAGYLEVKELKIEDLKVALKLAKAKKKSATEAVALS